MRDFWEETLDCINEDAIKQMLCSKEKLLYIASAIVNPCVAYVATHNPIVNLSLSPLTVALYVASAAAGYFFEKGAYRTYVSKAPRKKENIPDSEFGQVAPLKSSASTTPTTDFVELLKTFELSPDKNMVIGTGENGRLITLDIRKIYHSIVSGSTGKGKSNFAHIIITWLLKTINQNLLAARLVLLDPKKSELKRYRDINSVAYSGDKIKMLDLIEKTEAEMDRRNDLIEQDKFVNNIETYNVEHPNDKLDYIVVYIEEIADLVMSVDAEYSAKFKSAITRLCQLGRSAGIRVFLSTQYPKADILDTIIKTNCLTRFGFAVPSSTESRVIMDSSILAKEVKEAGEMILKNNGEYTKIQVPHLRDKDVKTVVEMLENRHGRYVSHVSEQSENTENETVEKNVSHVSDKHIIGFEAVSDVKIQNENDLFNFYLDTCENEVFSLRKTAQYTNIGSTKLQEYRKKLIDDNYLIYDTDNHKTYLNQKYRIKAVK